MKPHPYDFARPVRDAAMFFGRREIRQEILSGVRQGSSFAIIGGTRIGKTSLLFQIRQALLEELKRTRRTVIGPVFLSTHEFPRLLQSTIYRRVIDEFRATLAISGSEEDWKRGVKLFDKDLNEDEAFDAFRQALETMFQTRDADRRIVVMIDEVDELRRYEWSHVFFNNLRHLISQTTVGERIAIIIAGTLAISSLYEVAGSPFLNVIQGTKTLDLLSRAETEELVCRPTDFQLGSSVVASMFFQTGGHPFLTQYLMKYLCLQFNADLKSAGERDVEAIVERYFDERSDFENWVSDFADSERTAYDLIATSRQGTTRADLVRAIGDPKQVNHALRMLVHIGVVREDGPNSNVYQVGGEMFRRWFYDTFAFKPGGGLVRGQPPIAPRAAERVRVIKVFVASPGDVNEERRALEPVVAEINRMVGPRLQSRLDLVKWETDTYPGVSAGGPQAVIDSQVNVQEYDVVIGIFWRRFGTPTDYGQSGSEHEIEQACESALRVGKPHVMVYFSDQPSTARSVEEIDQWRKVMEFRERLEKKGLCVKYEGVQQFTDLVRSHLTAFLQDYVSTTFS